MAQAGSGLGVNGLVQTGYGSAEVLGLKEIEKPRPSGGELLIRVLAASLAAGDCLCMRGAPFPARLAIGFPKPRKDFVVGLDFAGIVEAVGAEVAGFRLGDEVYGECRGACAEYAVARKGAVARKPRNLSFEQAAAVPTSACTALQGLRDRGKVRPGQKVLINGASGGVGTFAVQIAKAMGAEVTAVCSARNAAMVLSIGADRVIDYSKEDFTLGGPRYDLILDNAGSHSLSAARRALNPRGVHIPSSDRGGIAWILAAALTSVFTLQQGSPFLASTTGEDLVVLGELIEAGKIAPVIDRVYPLSDAGEAFRYLDGGHARAKVVIAVEQGRRRSSI
jgi:NADPH:quinone reductase-like Zn-dependent oxidoreductase